MRAAVNFIAGLIFGLGLLISGMANPAKLQNFLDLAGTFDPSLILVMFGAVVCRDQVQIGIGLEQGQRQIVIDVGVHAGQRELDAIYARLEAHFEQRRPCRRRALPV